MHEWLIRRSSFSMQCPTCSRSNFGKKRIEKSGGVFLIYKHNRLHLTRFKNQTLRLKYSGLEKVEVSENTISFPLFTELAAILGRFYIIKSDL